MPVILNQPLAVLLLPSSGLSATPNLDIGIEFQSLVDAPEFAKALRDQTEDLGGDQPDFVVEIGIGGVVDAVPKSRLTLSHWDQGSSAGLVDSDELTVGSAQAALVQNDETASLRDGRLCAETLESVDPDNHKTNQPFTDPTQAASTEIPTRTDLALPGLASAEPADQRSTAELPTRPMPLHPAPKITSFPALEKGIVQHPAPLAGFLAVVGNNTFSPDLGLEKTKQAAVVDGKSGGVIDLQTNRGNTVALRITIPPDGVDRAALSMPPNAARGSEAPSAVVSPPASSLPSAATAVQLETQQVVAPLAQNFPQPQLQATMTIAQTFAVPTKTTAPVSVPDRLAKIVEPLASVEISEGTDPLLTTDRTSHAAAPVPPRQSSDLATLLPIGPIFESALATTSPPDAAHTTTGAVATSFDVEPAPRDLARAHHIASQISAEIRSSGGGHPTEITLSPEELGKVRLVLHTVDDGLRLQIIAERPETADLIRRHIDTLAQEFRDIGFKSLSFDFAGQRQDRPAQQGQPDSGSQRDGARPSQSGNEPQPHNSHQQPAAVARRPSGSGLDLRL